MARRPVWFIIGTVFLVLLGGLLLPRETWEDVFLNPWRLVWGSHERISATLLDVSQSQDMKTMGERLLKPFGNVKLVRVYQSDEPKNP